MSMTSKKEERARFPDLVEFVYRQAKVANDPLFGDILDSTADSQKSFQNLQEGTQSQTSSRFIYKS